MNNPKQHLDALKGVGAQLAGKLAKLSLYTFQDLLFHLPYRYVDRTCITTIGSMLPYQSAVVDGEVRSAHIVYGKRRSLLCRIQDGSGSLNLRFYHFNANQHRAMQQGKRIRCYGEARPGASGLEIYHPEYQLYSAEQTLPLEDALTPAYHTTDGISQLRLRDLIEQVFNRLSHDALPELSPAQDRQTTLLERLRYLHFPPPDADLDALMTGAHPYQQCLIQEELSAYQLSLLRLKAQRLQQTALPLAEHVNLRQQFEGLLSFSLTEAQQRVCREIAHDLTKHTPMMRLLQGDVGSGKTVVAAISALQAIANGTQVALMAPTDILAEQHRHNFNRWFDALGIKLAWLSGKQKLRERRTELERIAKGEAQLVIGTHALFQDGVIFNNLALVIIDEQHRFGVQQRLQLRDKSKDQQTHITAHQLIMTATPIPRTLAMSAYADMDYSVIDQLPAGRIPITTALISQQRRQDVIARLKNHCQQGKQAYWVCTLIEQSESLSAEAAEETATMLTQSLPMLTIGLVHGRLKPKEKDALMTSFKAGEIDLLVATTVIEVGVDVPKASIMIIENPERLGLAQLHQLRGRVGRGSEASHCVLLYGDGLSQQSKARLEAMRNTTDGFKIAEVDLNLRGPGEVLGTRQTGDITFKLADLQRDLHLMPAIHQRAQDLLQQDPSMAKQLIDRWIGHSEQFAQA